MDKTFFSQPVKYKSMTYDHKNLRKIAKGQGDDYTSGCLLVVLVV